MYNYTEIKEFVENIGKSTISSTEKEKVAEEILLQLGFKINSCHCKRQLPNYISKIKNWLAKHNDICHYKVESGVLLWHNGVAVTTMNITDEIALELLNTENAKHIIQVLPYTNDAEISTTDATLFDIQQEKQSTTKEKKRITRKNK